MASSSTTPNTRTNPLSIQRGNYAWTLPGPLLLILGRLACLPLQHHLITSNPLGMRHLPTLSSFDPSFWPSFLPFPPPAPLTVFLAMTAVLVLKQGIWAFCISAEAMTVQFALFGVLADFVYEGVCAVVFSAALGNALWRVEMLYIGAVVHAVAAAVELGAEVQRKKFKGEKRNEGKVCARGLWGMVRHPNFALNVVYGAAYGMAAGGPLFALLPVGMYIGNFVGNAIEPKEEYLKERYKGQWEGYARRVRWKLCPGVY